MVSSGYDNYGKQGDRRNTINKLVTNKKKQKRKSSGQPAPFTLALVQVSKVVLRTDRYVPAQQWSR